MHEWSNEWISLPAEIADGFRDGIDPHQQSRWRWSKGIAGLWRRRIAIGKLREGEGHAMRPISRIIVVLGLGIGWATRPVLGENLRQAWDTALRVNAGLQAQQAQSMAAGLNVKAARSDRFPRKRNYTFNSFLTATPMTSTSSFFGSSGGGIRSVGAASGITGLPTAFPLFGRSARTFGLAHLCKRAHLYGWAAPPEHRRGRGPAWHAEE